MDKILIVLLTAVGCLQVQPVLAAATDNSTHTVEMTIVAADIRGEKIYQTKHLTLDVQTWRVEQWKELRLPAEWANTGLYVELWDATNHRIPQFRASRLHVSTLDLSTLDASLYPSFRVIVFQAKSPVSWPAMAVSVTYTESLNTRLIILLSLILLALSLLIIGSIKFRVTPHVIWQTTVAAIRVPLAEVGGQHMVGLAWMVCVWSAVFAVPLGSFAGWQQVVYLFIKIPFLFFCSFLISGLANFVLAKLIGVTLSVRSLFANAVQVLSVTAISLASVSPILWWLLATNQDHDAVLIWAVLLFGCAYVVGVFRLYRQYRLAGSKRPLVPVLLWMVLYGVVLLQLGWMLRPWVGVLDPVYHTIPFSRLYSGNVFEEILATLNRL
ncbi:MAG: hypothetical protein AAB515_01365 [Patescibacteria group bacterium]